MTSSRKHPPVCNVFIIHCYWLINHRILPVLQFFLSASHYHRYINTSMVPPLYLHRLGLALQSGSLVGDSRARRHGTICRGVWEKRRDSSNGRETAAWLSVCRPNQHSMLIAVADRASGTSEVSMLYPLRPRPSHAVASIRKAWWLFTATCLSPDYTTRIHECASLQRVKESSEMRTFLLNSNGTFIHYGGLQCSLKSALYN